LHGKSHVLTFGQVLRDLGDLDAVSIEPGLKLPHLEVGLQLGLSQVQRKLLRLKLRLALLADGLELQSVQLQF
jgi:hypothetical protein